MYYLSANNNNNNDDNDDNDDDDDRVHIDAPQSPLSLIPAFFISTQPSLYDTKYFH